MNDLRNELERLAERGPHREPSHVVGDALDELASVDVPRRRPRWPAVAAAVMLLGLIGVLATQIPSVDHPTPADQPQQPLPVDDDDAEGPDAHEDEGVPTTLASRQVIPCKAVRFEFTAAPDGFELVHPTDVSRSVFLGAYMPMEWLFMSRGGHPDRFPPVPAGREDELIEVEIMGYPTVVFAAAMGSPGPRTSFVFPADASPDDPCNVWSIAYGNSDMSSEQLVELVGYLQMTELD